MKYTSQQQDCEQKTNERRCVHIFLQLDVTSDHETSSADRGTVVLSKRGPHLALEFSTLTNESTLLPRVIVFSPVSTTLPLPSAARSAAIGFAVHISGALSTPGDSATRHNRTWRANPHGRKRWLKNDDHGFNQSCF